MPDEEAVALRLGIAALDAGNVTYAQHLAIEGPDTQVAYLLLVLDSAVHAQRYALAFGGVESGIDNLAGRLQRRHDLRGYDAVAGDLLLREYDVDHFVACTDNIDTLDALHVEQLATYVFRIAVHLRIVVPVGRQGVEDAVDIHHVVYDYGVVAPLG